MTDFLQTLCPRFRGVAPAPFGEWKGLVARGGSPFAASPVMVSPVMPPIFPELPLARAPYLPLESLRDETLGARLHGRRDEPRRFRSSGTTGQDRSIVRFSAAGLECYRVQSVHTLLSVLNAVTGVDPTGPDAPVGISLIPTVDEWPDSSLAQMVAWTAQVVPVRYTTAADFTRVVAELGNGPIWVFGTAFHLVDLFDSSDGLDLRLPKRSVVIETGGTKGRTRSVTRGELYSDIESLLGVEQRHIISEYGMCELAAQAYDFLAMGETGARRFRFPSWVKTSVLTGPADIVDIGRGALVVEDPLRVDAPWPIRTEDLVELDRDGFRLLGRIPSAPLKGCSLLAERSAYLAQESVAPEPASALSDVRATASLAEELGSEAAAIAALEDLRSGMPQSEGAWREATRVAHDGRRELRRWLFILPDNHSIVGIYPLMLAAAARLDVTVRVPTRFAGKDSFLMICIEDLKRSDAQIDVLPASFRIDDDKHGFEAILAYGDDDTIKALRDVAGVPVQGFGSRFGVSIVDAKTFTDDAANLARDFLSLGQTGCMASRLAVVVGDVDPELVASTLSDAARTFWSHALPWRERVGLDVEAFRLSRLGFTVSPGDTATPLVAVRSISLSQLTTDRVLTSLATKPFTLPVLIVNDGDRDTFVKTVALPLFADLPVSTATVSRSLNYDVKLTNSHHRTLSFQVLGRANAPTWDGNHETRALFRPH